MKITDGKRLRLGYGMNSLGMLAIVCGLLVVQACGKDGDSDVTKDESISVVDDTLSHATDSNAEPIIGGAATNAKALAAVGAITYAGHMHCSGTLISARKVVTAGHCVSGFDASQMRFVVGPSLDKATQTVRVVRATAHPNYNANTIANDIAVLILEKDVAVEPINPIDAINNQWVGTTLLFVGYGVNNGHMQTGYGIKRSVSMAVTEVTSQRFLYGNATANTCNGDSGGPALYLDPKSGTYRLVGVTSYGDSECTHYGADTRVDVYRAFITGAVEPLPAHQPNPSTPSPCGQETYAGRCSGNTLIWCGNNQVHKTPCGTKHKTCGFDRHDNVYACLSSTG